MTLHQRTPAPVHRMIFARQGNGNGNGTGNGNDGGDPSTTSTTTTTTTTTSSTTSSSTTTTSSTRTTSSPPPTSTPTTTSTSTTTTSTSTSSSTSSTPTTTSTGTTRTTATTSARTTASTGITTSPTVRPISTQGDASTTDTATGSLPSDSSSDSSSGSSAPIVGGVIGAIAGLAVMFFLVMFAVRKLKERKRSRPISDFGFNPDDMTTDKASSPVNEKDSEMYETGHHGAGAGGVAAAVAGYDAYGHEQDAAARQRAQLQERPKYVYGQDHDDSINGAYSTQPQVQTSYNPEAYGSYAQYDPSAGAGAAGYQDAQREYQGQAGGYTQQEYAAYSQYAGYDQHHATAGYDQSQYAQHQQQQYPQQGGNGYTAPHPYSNAGAKASAHDDAYGGM